MIITRETARECPLAGGSPCVMERCAQYVCEGDRGMCLIAAVASKLTPPKSRERMVSSETLESKSCGFRSGSACSGESCALWLQTVDGRGICGARAFGLSQLTGQYGVPLVIKLEAEVAMRAEYAGRRQEEARREEERVRLVREQNERQERELEEVRCAEREEEEARQAKEREVERARKVAELAAYAKEKERQRAERAAAHTARQKAMQEPQRLRTEAVRAASDKLSVQRQRRSSVLRDQEIKRRREEKREAAGRPA